MLVKTWNRTTLQSDPITKFKALQELYWHPALLRWEGCLTVKAHFVSNPVTADKFRDTIYNTSLAIRAIKKSKKGIIGYIAECLIDHKWEWVSGYIEAFWVVSPEN